MSTLELLQLQNEHKDNFFEKGEEMNFYDEFRKIMIVLAQIEGDSEIISINVRAGKHMYRISAQCEVEEID